MGGWGVPTPSDMDEKCGVAHLLIMLATYKRLNSAEPTEEPTSQETLKEADEVIERS